MKILITGTHLTPALAVIDKLKKNSGMEIIYLGRSTTMEGDRTKSVESQILQNIGIKFIPIISGRLYRTLTFRTILSLFKIPIGFLQAAFYIFKENPDVVLSMGGYISVPITVCAWFYSIPIIIHEQTLIPGLANKINSWFANKIAVSFGTNVLYKNKDIVLTGNPLRKEILNPKNPSNNELKEIVNLAKKNKQPLILITGGNQGSHAINQAVSKSLEDLVKISCVIHQTGDSKFADYDKLLVQKKSLQASEKYLVRKWINGNVLGFLLKHIDLAISRGGINTLLELAFYSIPTIVIPFPSVHNCEQNFNARFFEKIGLAKVLLQKNLTKDSLIENILDLVKDLEIWKKSAKQSADLVIPDAANRLALEVILLAKKKQ